MVSVSEVVLLHHQATDAKLESNQNHNAYRKGLMNAQRESRGLMLLHPSRLCQLLNERLVTMRTKMTTKRKKTAKETAKKMRMKKKNRYWCQARN